jgi:hypothetical protein
MTINSGTVFLVGVSPSCPIPPSPCRLDGMAATLPMRAVKYLLVHDTHGHLEIRFRDNGEMAGGKTIVIALPAGTEVPHLPPSGLKPTDDLRGLNVVAEIGMTGKAIFAPGPDPSVYAYSRMTVQRNLYRIPLQ